MGDNKQINTKKKLVDNIVLSGLYQVLVMIVPIITTPYITRIFQSNQMGEYGVAVALSSFFVIFANFGFSLYGSREIAKAENLMHRSDVFFSLISIQIITMLFSNIIYIVVCLYVLKIDNIKLYLIQSLLITISVFDISWFYTGIEEIKKTLFRNLLSKIFTTIAIFSFVKNNTQMNLYALINILGMFLGNISMIIPLKKHIQFRRRSFNIKKTHIIGSSILLTPQLIKSSYTSLDRTILLTMSNSYSVGIYDQAKKIINLSFSIVDASLRALMPRMSFLVANKHEKQIRSYIDKGLFICGIFSVVMVTGIFSVSDYFVSFFFGEGYGGVSQALKISSLSFIVMPSSIFLVNGLLIPLKKDTNYLFSIVIMTIVGIGFNLILDNRFSYMGAVIAFVLSETVGWIIGLYNSREYVKLFKFLSDLIVNCIIINVSIQINLYVQKYISFDSAFMSFLFFGVLSIIINFFFICIKILIRNKRNGVI